MALFTAIAFASTMALCASGYCGTGVKYNLDEQSGLITIYGDGPMDDYDIITFHNHTTNTSWNDQRAAIKRIVIDDGVTKIGSYAFIECEFHLESLEIGSSVNSVGEFILQFSNHRLYYPPFPIYFFGTNSPKYTGSSDVKPINLDGLRFTLHLPTIYQDTKWAKIDLHVYNSLKDIPSGYCGKADQSDGKDVKWVLNKANKKCIISGVTEWTKDFKEIAANGAEQPLSFKKSDIETILLKKGVTIGDTSFDGFSSLTAINVATDHDDYQSIDGVLFSKDGTRLIKCPNARTSYKIPNTTQTVEADAFDDCSKLTAIEVDDNSIYFQSIDGVLFSKDGTKLIKVPAGNPRTSYEIPDTIQIIEADAFDGCRKITSIRFNDTQDLDPKDEKKIFKNCNSNLKINVPGEYVGDKFCGKDVIKDYYKITYKLNGGTLADGSPDKYYVTVSTKLIAPSKPDYIFSGWTVTDSSGTMPEPFVCICHHSTGDKSFTANWIDINLVDFGYCGKNGGENLMWIFNTIFGKFTVSGTGEMADFARNSGMMLLGAKTMNDNTCPWNKYKGLIKSIIIESGVTSIGKDAFSNCNKLTSITISESVTVIGNSAFSDCSDLETINFQGNKEPTFGNDVFASCNIKTINVPNDYEGDDTFGGISVTKEDETKDDSIDETKNDSIDETKNDSIDETKNDSIDETKNDSILNYLLSDKNAKSSGGAKAGIVIGTFAGVSVIVGAVGIFLFLKNRQNDSKSEASDKAVPTEDAVPENGEAEAV
jgi:uncharacterized repeat protein (TIGR02543 family)